MPKSTVQKKLCEACGAPIREGSAFCFKCGETVVREPAPPAIVRPDPALLNGRAKGEARANEFAGLEPPPVAVPSEDLDAPSQPRPAAKTEIFPAATTPRRRPGVRVRKVSEVEWVEGPTWSVTYIVVTLVLAVVVGLLVAAAISMR